MAAEGSPDPTEAVGGQPRVRAGEPLPNGLAIALVTGTSAAVLVLEILAGRLLAPYVGVSLETFTGIIGTILAGIAVGAWAGGYLADRFDPRRVVPLLLMTGGVLAIASIPVVRLLGPELASAGGVNIIALAAFGFLPAATVLSAVPPAVVKLQLRDLSTTGVTVGRLSAYSTAGAIVGTFLTGFVLVAWAAVTTLVVTVGLLLIASGVALWAAAALHSTGRLFSLTALVAVMITGVVVVDSPCQTQTAYYCVSVEVDAGNPSGRVLRLDDLRHSYVDLDDPTHLEFWYIRRLVDAIEILGPEGLIDVIELGGGGFTIPRYLQATRPGSNQTVMEIDEDLVGIVVTDLEFDRAAETEIVVGDARLSMTDRPSDSADIVIGDAFGSRAVPFHLATREFLTDLDRVLRPGGVYAANVIDSSALDFLRAEAATIADVFPHVVVILGAGAAAGFGGNSVIVASDQPIDRVALAASIERSGDAGRVVEDITAFLDGALLLTDDFAPVDQLISGAR